MDQQFLGYRNQSLPRRDRLESKIKKKLCCYTSEKWKDLWKTNNRGQKVLKCMMGMQVLVFGLIQIFVGVIWVQLASEVDQPPDLKSEIQLQYFFSFFRFWFFVIALYFLWHSLNRSIVVELISYNIVMVSLNIINVFYDFYYWSDKDFFQENENQFVIDDQLKTMIDIQRYLFWGDSIFQLLCLFLQFSIYPAIYEDVKDNIFLALGGNQVLWDNFYQITWSKSVIKLHYLVNLQFWTSLFLLLINITDFDLYFYLYLVIYGSTFILAITSNQMAYKALVTLKKGFYSLFMTTHFFKEAFQIYFIAMMAMNKTVLFENMEEKFQLGKIKIEKFEFRYIYFITFLLGIFALLSIFTFFSIINRIKQTFDLKQRTANTIVDAKYTAEFENESVSSQYQNKTLKQNQSLSIKIIKMINDT